MGDTRTAALQSGAVATGNGNSLDLQGASIANIQVLIAATATVAFEVTVDRVNWSTLMMVSRADSAVTAITASSSGIYYANVHGLMAMRARVSAWTSGAVTAIGSSYTVA